MLKSVPANEDKLKTILNNIRKARNRCGYSQAYVAGVLKISRHSYNRKENGSAGITLTEFFKIAEILKIEPTVLIESRQDEQQQT